MRKGLWIVFVVFVLAGYTFAGHQSQCQDQSQDQSQTQNVDQSTSVSVKDRVQGVPSGMPRHLWQVPEKEAMFLWNKYGFPKKFLEGTWERSRAKEVIKNTGHLGAELGWGFEKGFIPTGNKDTDSLELMFYSTFKQKEEDVLEEYDVMDHPINISAKKKFTQYETLAYAVDRAMESGADAVVVLDGMNVINNGTSFGLGMTAVNSEGSGAITGIGGIGSAETRKQGEPAVILLLLKEKVVEKAQSNAVPARSVPVNVENPNGSYVVIYLRKKGDYYIGPRGEYYSQLPTPEQLKVYALK